MDARRSFSALRLRLDSLIFAFMLALPSATVSTAEVLQVSTTELHFGKRPAIGCPRRRKIGSGQDARI